MGVALVEAGLNGALLFAAVPTLKILPGPREVARSGFAMLLLLGLCLGLPLFSESQEEARSWDDTSEQVSRRKSCGISDSVPSLQFPGPYRFWAGWN